MSIDDDPNAEASSLSFIGVSDAPKSTVAMLICCTPPPDAIDS